MRGKTFSEKKFLPRPPFKKLYTKCFFEEGVMDEKSFKFYGTFTETPRLISKRKTIRYCS